MNGHPYQPAAPAPPEPVRFAGEVRRLALGPADRLVLKIDTHLSHDMSERLRLLLGKSCSIDPSRVIVLGLGMDLSVVGPEAGPQGELA